MTATQLPAIFDTIVERPAHEWMADEQRAVGVTCSFVPEPLLSVDGLVPVRVRARGSAATPLADTYLSSVVCPYVRALLESVLDGAQRRLAGWVLAASCDHLRRLVDNLEYLEQPAFLHVLDVPHKSDDLAVEFYAAELGRLAERLAEAFDVDLSTEAVQRAIAAHNEHLEIIRCLYELRFRDPPALSGADLHRVLVACSLAPKDRLREPLRELCRRLERSPAVEPPRARLLVVGSQVDDPGYLRVIESQGAVVVADRFCCMSLPLAEPIAITAQPIRELARHHLRQTSCPRMMDSADDRLDEVARWAELSHADGIVLAPMKFCDLWGVESSLLGDALRERGFPVLRLEREYALSGEGQTRTRVQAFIESMGK
ncbi:MAG: 2-hydroxyacyl-CoA dehydratase [Deltaproteobacteria bacterium]|jgi:benzoyl-CoA reductase/2-hydroxyglutaryl-CoA dehydratase subunit BcrC/BadD/HgdB|nr:2-hydroxyacyl-CoA dehydratase [Deltaproteobacteria bacterium]MBW2535598.1 2-hydroxyacyl-CoA dehydratase [Deltaproteobacteria bacterium]